MGDDESDAGPPKTPRQPESGWDVGGGWDIGQRAAVPMPYYVFPENTDTVVRGMQELQAAIGDGARWEELAAFADVLAAVSAAALKVRMLV